MIYLPMLNREKIKKSRGSLPGTDGSLGVAVEHDALVRHELAFAVDP
jgi:hypothetical protein